MQILISKRFKMIRKLSSGAFGQIYQAININTGQQLAIKLQKCEAKHPQLLRQAKMLVQLLNGSSITDKGVPSLYFSGKQGDYNVMVIQLLGANLQQLLDKNGGIFSIKTSLMLALQMVKRLQYLHSRGYLHRDVKPQNFMIGKNEKKQKLYVIDFGLSKRYVKNNQHIEYAQGRSMAGTVRYASINTHLGIQPTRRDDLQSLIYIIFYFLYGKLPWQNQKAQTKTEKYNKIMSIKLQNKPQLLFKNLPQQVAAQLTLIFVHIRKLSFTQKPNYQYIKQKISQAMASIGCDLMDYLYDWVQGQKSIGKSFISIDEQKQKQKAMNNSRVKLVQDKTKKQRREKRKESEVKIKQKLDQQNKKNRNIMYNKRSNNAQNELAQVLQKLRNSKIR